MFKNLLLILVAAALPLKGMSSDVHLRLTEASKEVFDLKDDAYTLAEIHEKVAGDQVDLQVSYENLIQAQNKISQARAQYFPYGLGTVGVLYYLNSFNPLILVELVTSLPSKIYNVQKEKNLRMAQVYSNKALALNIKNQVDNLYYTVLKEEASLRLAIIELSLLETIYSARMDNVALGLENENDLRRLELRILDARDIILKFESYLIEEKSAFNILVGNDPTASFDVQPVSTFLSSEMLSGNVHDFSAQAIERSPELVAASYAITAAEKNRKSYKWSVLSFSGIGFGYWSNVNIAGSQVKAAAQNKALIERTISNQVFVLNTDLSRTLKFFENENAISEESELFYESELAKFHSSEINLNRLAESGILFVKDYAQMVSAHYDSLSKLSDFERAINGKVEAEKAPTQKKALVASDVFTVKHKKLRFFRFSLSIESTFDIEKVTYEFDSDDLRVENETDKRNGFDVIYPSYLTRALKGTVTVTLKTGEEFKQDFNFTK